MFDKKFMLDDVSGVNVKVGKLEAQYQYFGPYASEPVRTAKLRETKKGRQYFVAYGQRVFLDECQSC